MQRSHQLGLAAVLTAATAATVFLWPGARSAQLPEPSTDPGPAPVTLRPAAADGDGAAVVDAGAGRQVVSTPTLGRGAETDPEVRAALTGFRGRVVDHNKTPVADCGVKIFRFALDSLLPEDVDLFSDHPTLVPDFEAGETITGEDGTFLIDGIWPKAFYLLHAGIGTDAPSHRMLPHSPAPGEVLDLGDIVLNHAAVLTGRVVDDDDMPVADAVVRAVDLPGQMLGFVPAERFDPTGCVLIRESQSPVQVVEMPSWLPNVFDQLPIPTTRTDAAGEFRLRGLVAGNNLVAITRPDFLAFVKSSVRLAAGEEKSLGTVRLDRGEELYGKVLDSAGEPIAGAQVVAGSTLSMLPFDFASYVGPSDQQGKFSAEGFGAGKVTVAARRTDKDPWVMAEPQPILRDVVVTLPAVASLTVRITGVDGVVVNEPKLRLLAASDQEAAVVMSMFGVLRAVEIDSRTSELEDGGLRIDGLQLGRYVLMASDEGARLASADVHIQATENAVELEFEPGIEHRVRVVGPEDRPIRSARVYAQERGASVREMPWCAGRTDDQGRLRIEGAGTERLRVTASHPRWGSVHGEARTENGELLLRMQQPGWITGTLTHLGRAPEPAKFTVTAEWRPKVRGAGEDLPVLATPGLDGSFVMQALQPGRYRLEVISSLEALTSPGGIFTLAQSMMMTGADMPRQTVQVVSGEGAQAHLNVGGPDYSGPTGNVFGSVLVDGQLASGYLVSARNGKHRVMKEVDSSGRFDLGAVPVGKVRIGVFEGGNAMLFGQRDLWRENFEIVAAEQKEVVVDIRTTSLSGVVVRPDGSPAAGMHIRAEGRPLEGRRDFSPSAGTMTDANGAFLFEKLAEGVFTLKVRSRRGDPLRGEFVDVTATNIAPATGLRLELHMAAIVAGRIDARAFAKPPDWAWMEFHRVDSDHPADRGRAKHVAGQSIDKSMSFETGDLEPGSYFVSVHVSLDGESIPHDVPEPLVVPPQGLSGLVLLPLRRGSAR